MSAQIMVIDRNSRPISNARVFVSWYSGGHSEAKTNNSGIADLKCSPGLTNYIQIDDVTIIQNFALPDGIQTFSHPKK